MYFRFSVEMFGHFRIFKLRWSKHRSMCQEAVFEGKQILDKVHYHRRTRTFAQSFSARL